MSNFWNKENSSTSEWETIEETLDDQAQAVLDTFEEDDGNQDEEEETEEMEDFTEEYRPKGESAYKLDKRESSILTESTIRLEQARLYEMLIKHDLFQGVKANQRALNNVQNELKAYIVSRLEVLLGIRKEVVEEQKERQLIVESPFNDIEIEFLKALSFKGTKGASLTAAPKTLTASETKPLSEKKLQQTGLRPIVQDEDEEEIRPIRRREESVRKAQPKRREEPTPQPKRQPIPQPKRREEPMMAPRKGIQRKRKGDMTNAEAEEIAREELKNSKGMGLTKHPYEMTTKELKEVAKRNNRAVRKIPPNALPPATSAQAEYLVQQQQLQMQSTPGSAGVNLLVQKLILDKNK